MMKYSAHLKFNILFLIGLAATVIKIVTAESGNLQHQRYDYIDVAKETVSGRNKGQTTRIFTTGDDLDETFWLKYLGEEFRHAVRLHVDDDNNVVLIEQKRPKGHHHKSNNIENKEEKRTRFVRQPSDDNKQIPVESLYKLDDNQYPTEKPEQFNVKPTTSHMHYTKHKHSLNDNTNNKIALKHKKKVLIHDKYKQKIIKVQPSSPLKAIHEPIVVNLPQTEEAEHQINEEQVPVVVQMPPVIYHQKADLYTAKNPNSVVNHQMANIYNAEISNLPLNYQKDNLYYGQIPNLAQSNPHPNTHSYPTQTHTFSHLNVPVSDQHLDHNPQSDYTIHNQMQQPYSYQKLPLSYISLNQLSVPSFAPPPPSK